MRLGDREKAFEKRPFGMSRDETALERRTVIGKRARRVDGMWSGAWRLAKLEVGYTWTSYLTSSLFALLVGLFSSSPLWAVPDGSGARVIPALLLVDLVFLSALTNLGINWTSARWLYVHTDPFTLRLSFLKTLPIPVRGLILSRLVVVLVTTALTSLLFFAPSYALFPPLRVEVPPAQYLWFALFWIGYVLFSAGLLLFLELGAKGVTALVACLVWATLLLTVVVVTRLLGVPLVEESLELVGTYGPLAAIPALVAGGGGLLLWCRLTEKRLDKRELAS